MRFESQWRLKMKRLIEETTMKPPTLVGSETAKPRKSARYAIGQMGITT